jgi:hypothetical protein
MATGDTLVGITQDYQVIFKFNMTEIRDACIKKLLLKLRGVMDKIPC